MQISHVAYHKLQYSLVFKKGELFKVLFEDVAE